MYTVSLGLPPTSAGMPTARRDFAKAGRIGEGPPVMLTPPAARLETAAAGAIPILRLTVGFPTKRRDTAASGEML